MEMKRLFPIVAVLAAFAMGGWVVAQEDMPGQAAQPQAQSAAQTTQHYSYAIGLEIGRNFKREGTPLDLQQLLAGVKDGLAGAQPQFDEKTLEAAMRQLERMQMDVHVRKNKDYLDRNSKAEGVTVLPSGLQYKVLRQGDGPKPAMTDTVKAHYSGRLIDGTEFDSSYKRKEPFVTRLDQVIPGWTEALKNMQVGSKWLIVVPSELAYGPRGAGGVIPPHATLIFEMELLGIQ